MNGKYCLIGEKLSHSYSAEIHRKNGLDYSLVELEPTAVERFMREGGYDGFNVTIPYKKAVIPYLDWISDEAREMGSVNTVKRVNGKNYGYNTDVIGMERAFYRAGVNLENKRVIVLGSGGAGNTAAYLARNKGARVSTVSRRGDINYDNCYEKFQDAEIIINATPVGMYPDTARSPIDLSRFCKAEAVFDCIYNPFRTELLLQAEKAGIIPINGLSMLVEQALQAEKIWQTGCLYGLDEIVGSIYREKTNLVLYGMPSCGKSTIGSLVAKELNRPFVDTDKEITALFGVTPEEIIENEGEEEFRKKESIVINRVASEGGKVISVGGGAVIRETNVDALKKNGVLIYLQRDIKKLISDGRPISRRKGIEELFNERRPIYERIKEGVCSNDGDVDYCVKGVIKEYENTCDKRR